MMHREDLGHNATMWVLLAVGAGIGIAYAATARRRRGGWEVARRMTRGVAARKEDLAEAGKNIVERIGIIYDQSRKLVEEAADLWDQGRTVLRRAA